MTGNIIPDQAFDQLFRNARTANGWQDSPVSDDLLKKMHDIAKFGPTSANCCPLRIVFLKTPEAKERLKPALAAGNIDKMMSAPVVAIFANDNKFYDGLPKLFPHTDARAWFVGNDALIATTAMRNGTLQAAYYMIAARGLGLDCGPISGFDNAKVDAEFFAGTSYSVNFICAMGYIDNAKTHPRSPRYDFDEIAKIL